MVYCLSVLISEQPSALSPSSSGLRGQGLQLLGMERVEWGVQPVAAARSCLPFSPLGAGLQSRPGQQGGSPSMTPHRAALSQPPPSSR